MCARRMKAGAGVRIRKRGGDGGDGKYGCREGVRVKDEGGMGWGCREERITRRRACGCRVAEGMRVSRSTDNAEACV